MKYRLGLDIGATKTNILLLDGKDKIKARSRIQTDSVGSPEPIVESLGLEIEKILDKKKVLKSKIDSLGVGLTGMLEPATGIVDNSPNLKWFNVQFRRPLEIRLGMDVYLSNDVNAAAWGEFTYGAGRKSRDMAAVFVGSGIGGGIVCNGRLVEGTSGTAGEVGHLVFRENGLKCDCGNRGCFEAYGGGVPMERRMRKAVKEGRSPMVSKMVAGNLDQVNTHTIFLAAQKGDRVAGAIWKDAEQALGLLCANLISMLNPDCLVLGGGVLEGTPELLDTVKQIAHSRSVQLSSQKVKLVSSTLGSDAVALGAAAIAELYR